jgi:hypothetical protein
MSSERPGVADVRPAWLLWRPREPRWFPSYGPTAEDPTGSTPIADHTYFDMALALYLALAWALMLLIAPFVFVARLLRRHAGVRFPWSPLT